ncbi:hypothetical protein TNCV_1872001 [Trichonephila clavipes]|nr:hypothetical protein TNCV_1872001 [Trichonephila clavipes]
MFSACKSRGKREFPLYGLDSKLTEGIFPPILKVELAIYTDKRPEAATGGAAQGAKMRKRRDVLNKQWLVGLCRKIIQAGATKAH